MDENQNYVEALAPRTRTEPTNEDYKNMLQIIQEARANSGQPLLNREGRKAWMKQAKKRFSKRG